MAICPKCKGVIEHLDHYQSGEMKYTFNEVGTFMYDEVGFQGDNGTCDYECPLCKETLFTDEEIAMSFLEGGEHDVTNVDNNN